MKSKKILIITKNFPPYSTSIGGMTRMLKLAEFLILKGYEVFFLCAKGRFISYYGYRDLLSRLNITYISDPFQRIDNKSSSSDSLGSKIKSKKFQKFKRLVKDFIIPDKGILFIHRYLISALRNINYYKIHNVIISSPPFSLQIVGLALKAILKSRINLIIDYRDGWNVSKIFKKKNKIANKISKYIEKYILVKADKILCATEPMLMKINENILSISNKSLLVMNGFDEKMIIPNNGLQIKKDYMNIGYFGGISDKHGSYRDPTLFLEALLILNLNIRISFWGNISLLNIWKEKLGDKLEIHAPVDHFEALELMKQYDLLLVVHTEKEDSDEVATGKIFDYFSALKPVLIIGPDDMLARSLVIENRIGYYANCYDLQEIKATLEKIYNYWKTNSLIKYNYDRIEIFSRQKQFEKIISILR